MPQSSSSMALQDWLLLLLLSVLWGGTFFFTGIAIKELPAFTIVWWRVCLAALTLHAVLRLFGQRFPTERPILLAFLGMGLLNNVLPFCLIVTGQKHIASGLAAILNATTPLFTVVVAHFLTADEKLGPRKLGGVVVGFLGVVVMIGGSVLQEIGSSVGSQILVLCAACIYAFAGIFGRRFRRMGVPPLATAAGQVTASSLILFPVMLLVDRPWQLPMPGQGAILAVVAMAVFSTALAYIIYFRLLARVGATSLALVTFLIPLTAIVLGTWRLGETLSSRHYLGMACVLSGLALIDGRVLDLIRNRALKN
jgi:drug/metabolite transporter (DMT)-like permease